MVTVTESTRPMPAFSLGTRWMLMMSSECEREEAALSFWFATTRLFSPVFRMSSTESM